MISRHPLPPLRYTLLNNGMATKTIDIRFCLDPRPPVRAHVLYGWSLRFCCPLSLTPTQYPVSSHMFKVNNRKTRSSCEIYSKLTIKTPERRL